MADDVRSSTDKNRASLKSIFSLTTRSHLALLIFAIITAIVAGAVKPGLSVLIGRIFEDLTNFGAETVSQRDLITGISKWTLALTILGGITWITNGIYFYLWISFGELQAFVVRETIFKSLLQKDMEWFDLREDGVASLSIRIQARIRELQMATSQPMGLMIADMATLLTAASIAFWTSWKLTLVILATVPASALALAFIGQNLKLFIEQQNNYLTTASKYANGAIINIATVKSFNGEDWETWRYADQVRHAAKFYLKQARIAALQFGFTRFVITAMFVQGFWYGIVLVRQGLSTGTVLTTFYACLQATQAVEQILPQWLVLTKGMSAGASLRIIVSQVQQESKVIKSKGSHRPSRCQGDIEMTKISFAYPSNGSQLVLRNANFFFPAGEITFLIGRSGSGKSTITNLLMRFYEPSSGNITIDGHSIRNLDPEWLRTNITLVQQHDGLFNASLYRNIALGIRNIDSVTFMDVLSGCRTACLEETVRSFPNGLHTIVGSGGNNTSGGQRQRIALARARLRDSSILILDEATSALDQFSKQEVMESIRRWRRGKTTIIITHDVSQILEHDYVFILDDARICEEGYRRDLERRRDGMFSSFVPQPDTGKPPYEDIELQPMPARSQISHYDLDEVDQIGTSDSDISRHERTSLTYQFGHRNSLGIASSYASAIITNNLGTIRETQDFRGNVDYLTESPTVSTNDKFKVLPWRYSSNRANGASNRSSVPEITNRKEPRHLESTPIFSQPHLPSEEIKLQSIRQRKEDVVSDNSYSPSFSVVTPHQDILKSSGTNKPASLRQILNTIWPTLMIADKLRLIAAFVCAFGSAAATPIFSYVLSQLLNTFYQSTDQDTSAKKWSLSILGIALFDGSMCFIMHYFLERCGQSWVDALRIQALERILIQPKSWFDEQRNNTTRLVGCLDRNAEEMKILIGRFAGYIFIAISMIIISVTWACITCWKLTLVGLASMPLVYGITRSFDYVSSKWEGRSDHAGEKCSAIFSETFNNIRVVRSYTLESFFLKRYLHSLKQAHQVGQRRALLSGIFFGASDSSTLFITALIFYYGTLLVSRGHWSVNSIIECSTLLLFGIGNANSIVAFVPQISLSSATATYLLFLANLPQDSSHEMKGDQVLTRPIPIRFTNVSFSYPSRPKVQVLRNVSINFETGSCTAIVGPSGSGKSTIAHLILGLFAPRRTTKISRTENLISFAGIPMSMCHTSSLRSRVSIVSQIPTIFAGTITENILYGLAILDISGNSLDLDHPFGQISSSTTVKDVELAAKSAGIHEYIASLPLGYNTLIGDGGQDLSGGQAQRIAIARALIRKPSVLILDEATSALDHESALTIQRTIKSLIGRRSLHQEDAMTVIIITHSISMMEIADNVIMMEKGEVVEAGSFVDLKGGQGPFSRLMKGNSVD